MSYFDDYEADMYYREHKLIERLEREIHMENLTNVTTEEVRLSFVHLFKPYAYTQGQEEKFQVTVLVPKTDIATMGRINAAIEAAKQKGISEKWNGQCPPMIQTPVHDGDGTRPSDGMPFGAECKGCWVFTASAKVDYPPQVVDANMNPIINQSEIYSGIYGKVNVNFFPYAFGGKKGIGCGLGPVMKIRDGESLGGRSMSADQAFGAPTQQGVPQTQPIGYGQPVQPTAQPGYMNAPQGMPQSQVPWPQGQPMQPQINPITGLPM